MQLENKFSLTGATVIDGTGSDPQTDQAITIDNGVISKIENR